MFHIIKRTLAVATVAVAIAPSAAYARFELEPAGAAGAVPTGAVGAAPSTVAPPAATQPASSSSPGFQWDDAGVGAAAVLALFGASGAASVLVRRRRGQQTATS